MAKKWEYCTVQFAGNLSNYYAEVFYASSTEKFKSAKYSEFYPMGVLTELGSQGWEAISFYRNARAMLEIVVMKREQIPPADE